jgi:acyl-CoA synthetase (AMP-forming)/AMP-acid ligase II
LSIFDRYFLLHTGTKSWATRRLGCVGVPLPGVTVRIIDPETMEERPSDTDGEVNASACIGKYHHYRCRKKSFCNRSVLKSLAHVASVLQIGFSTDHLLGSQRHDGLPQE